ncbi:MAG TPA: ATP-binding cassette domain-containing protein [Trebonia sp.]|nr:ATP-binding cassette domain-containing protein [Trebonia sp.]
MNTPPADTAIEARGLVKRFGKTIALNGVDLSARKGTVLGLLGPNGAGKTTAVRCLATLIRADAGTASVLGYDVQRDAHQVRQLIGLTGQYASVDEMLSGFNNLVMIGRLLGIGRRTAKARASELLERFGLADAATRPAKTYSGGMRRRLDLAASMVGRPAVLFLDEPTTGLDPRSRNELWEMVRGLTADGATVLLTTQYLEEADRLCHDITVIDHGSVIAAGTPDELKARVGGQVLAVTAADPSRATDVKALIAERTGLAPATSPESGTVTVQVTDPGLVPTLVRELDEKGIVVEELTLRKPSLDEVFLSLTGSLPPEEPATRTQETAGSAL